MSAHQSTTGAPGANERATGQRAEPPASVSVTTLLSCAAAAAAVSTPPPAPPPGEAGDGRVSAGDPNRAVA